MRKRRSTGLAKVRAVINRDHPTAIAPVVVRSIARDAAAILAGRHFVLAVQPIAALVALEVQDATPGRRLVVDLWDVETELLQRMHAQRAGQTPVRSSRLNLAGSYAATTGASAGTLVDPSSIMLSSCSLWHAWQAKETT